MKKVLSIFALLLCTGMIIAQNGIHYKALIKDANGNVLSASPVSIQFIIYKGAELTDNVYQESHVLSTDSNGFIITSIGKGISSDDFGTINWGGDEHFLNVQINTGSGLVDFGTTQFMAVPYALTSEDNEWKKNGNHINTTNYAVGINSENPEHTLDLRSASLEEASSFNMSNSDKSKFVRFFSGSDLYPDPSMTWAPEYDFLFASYNDSNSNFNEYMRISSEGHLGLGISDPEATLDIAGGDWNLEAGNPGDFRIGSLAHNFRIGVATGGGGAGITRMYTNSNALILGTNDSADLIIDQNGILSAPSMTNAQIESVGNKALATKEYVDAQTSSHTNVAFKCRLNVIGTLQTLQNVTEQQLNFEYAEHNYGGGVFNATNHSYTIPYTGVYVIRNKLQINFDDANEIAIVSKIYVNGAFKAATGKQFTHDYSDQWSQQMTFSEQLALNQGDVITYRITAGFTTTGNLPKVLNNSSMSIYKVY
ncbi:hypothetical protein [Winogradskyella sp.]|uniref:hypothetical protein n=1 Tax=Winogradskyella sp. TaxID=1883156 RepID=UPI003BAD00B8